MRQRIGLVSVLVADYDEAIAWYTEVLGFVTKQDLDVGGPRWITLVSPEGSPDIELALEPTGHPAAPAWQKGLYDSDRIEI